MNSKMIPNLFSNQKIPKKIPEEMQSIVDKINKCKTKEQALRKAYAELTKTHSGSVYGVWKDFPTLFIRNIDKLWKTKRMACTGLTFLLRVLLVKSRHFTEKEVLQKRKIILLICPHVFLRANTGRKWVDVDVWGKATGINFGSKANGKQWFRTQLKKK